jgi:hypothetical protein
MKIVLVMMGLDEISLMLITGNLKGLFLALASAFPNWLSQLVTCDELTH